MANESSTNFSVAQKLQGQFRFYVVSLIFTLLAASVQTAKLNQSNFETIIELAAWLALLLSGLAALWYIEWEPIIRERLAHRSNYSQHLSDAKRLRLQGVTTIHVLEDGQGQPIDTRIANLQESIARLTENIDRVQSKNYAKYGFARATFIIGIVLLLVARASAAIAGLFGYQLL